MTQSQKLLGDFVERQSEAAFGELVSDYIDLVYSVSARLIGDKHLARDVTQIVFIDLARMAAHLPKNVLLGGWLHRHTCYVASTFMRSERRRQARETKAMEMNLIQDHTETNLARVMPILDEAINELDSSDRNALVLRFFDQNEFAAIGQALGSTEEAARKRVNRALQKVQVLLAKRGFALSSAALASTLVAEAVTAAPAGLGLQITSAALSATVPTSLAGAKLFLMATLKMKTAVITALLIAGIATPIVLQRNANRLLLAENTLLRQQLGRASQTLPNGGSSASNLNVGPTGPKVLATSQVPFTWHRVESNDYKQYVANLQAIGCPPDTIRDIVSQDLRKSFGMRRWEFLRTTASHEYWKSDFQPSTLMDREKLRRLEEMDDEFNWAYKEILGSTDPEQHFVQNIDSIDQEIVAEYGNLDFSKFEAIKGHIKDFRTQLHLLSVNESPELREELRREIASELTPQEMEDYEVRCSDIAKQLRAGIPKESPLNEEEFRAAYRSLRKSVDASSLSPISPSYINRALAAAVSAK